MGRKSLSDDDPLRLTSPNDPSRPPPAKRRRIVPTSTRQTPSSSTHERASKLNPAMDLTVDTSDPEEAALLVPSSRFDYVYYTPAPGLISLRRRQKLGSSERHDPSENNLLHHASPLPPLSSPPPSLSLVENRDYAVGSPNYLELSNNVPTSLSGHQRSLDTVTGAPETIFTSLNAIQSSKHVSLTSSSPKLSPHMSPELPNSPRESSELDSSQNHPPFNSSPELMSDLIATPQAHLSDQPRSDNTQSLSPPGSQTPVPPQMSSFKASPRPAVQYERASSAASSALSSPPTPQSISMPRTASHYPSSSSHASLDAPRRTLRARTQIQKNPYTIESAQYRAMLKLRGQKEAIVRRIELEKMEARDRHHASGDEDVDFINEESQGQSLENEAEDTQRQRGDSVLRELGLPEWNDDEEDEDEEVQIEPLRWQRNHSSPESAEAQTSLELRPPARFPVRRQYGSMAKRRKLPAESDTEKTTKQDKKTPKDARSRQSRVSPDLSPSRSRDTLLPTRAPSLRRRSSSFDRHHSSSTARPPSPPSNSVSNLLEPMPWDVPFDSNSSSSSPSGVFSRAGAQAGRLPTSSPNNASNPPPTLRRGRRDPPNASNSSQASSSPHPSSQSSEESSSSHNNAKAKIMRKKMRIAQRMLPAVYLRKEKAAERNQKVHARQLERSGSSSPSDLDKERNQDVRPGIAIRKVTAQPSRGPIIIQGDAPSSSPERSPVPSRESDSQSDIEFVSEGPRATVRSNQHRYRRSPDSYSSESVVAISWRSKNPPIIDLDDDVFGSDDEESQALRTSTFSDWVDRPRVAIREGDLIDRMLSRTRRSRRGAISRAQSRKTTRRGVERGHRASASTGESRRSGVPSRTRQPLQRVQSSGPIPTAHLRSERNSPQQWASDVERGSQKRASPSYRQGPARAVHLVERRGTANQPRLTHIVSAFQREREAQKRKQKKDATLRNVYIVQNNNAVARNGDIRDHLFSNDQIGRSSPQRTGVRRSSATRKSAPSISKGMVDLLGDEEDYKMPQAVPVPQGPQKLRSAGPLRPPQRQHQLTKNASPPPAEPPPLRHITKTLSSIPLDFDIRLLLPSTLFFHSTYIENARLSSLVNMQSAPPNVQPRLSAHFDIDSTEYETFATFLEHLTALLDWVFAWATGSINGPEVSARAEELILSACELLTWLLWREESVDPLRIEEFLILLRGLMGRVRQWISSDSERDSSLGYRSLHVFWMVIEMSFRCERGPPSARIAAQSLDETLNELVSRLLDIGLDEILPIIQQTFDDRNEDHVIESTPLEMWICSIHVFNAVASNAGMRSFWDCFSDCLNDQMSSQPQIQQGELVWKALFGLSAVSQFTALGTISSTPALHGYWPLVSRALKCISLDTRLDLNNGHPRDVRVWHKILRRLLARTLLLVIRWKWDPVRALDVIGQLSEIFRTRQFASLMSEAPNFPMFITEPEGMGLVDDYDPHDAGFDILLKLVIHASGAPRDEAESSRHVKRLLGYVVPVGVAQFTKDNPPMDEELSRLFNRYSAIIVALSLDQTEKTMQSRVQQARRYSDFSIADWRSRHAAIRAMMYFMIVIINASLQLDDALQWLESMNRSLLADFQQSEEALKKDKSDPWAKEQRVQCIIAIQMTFGAVRLVLESLSKNDESSWEDQRYPDPALLQADWLARLFQTSILENAMASETIRRFIQSFLNARIQALPAPTMPTIVTFEESPDEFGPIDFDLDDPALIAAMGGEVQIHPNQITDKITAQIMQDVISPTIYKLVTRSLGGGEQRIEDDDAKLERWIDCWVGCGHVLVQNNLKDWSHYMQWGPESWHKIIDTTGKRLVGLRFMYVVLRLDPMAYKRFKDEFIEMWFDSIVSERFTIEHLYTSRLFSIDGLRHPLLCDLPCERGNDYSDYSFSIEQLLELRILFIEKAIQTLESKIASLNPESEDAIRDIEMGRKCCLAMSNSMRDRHRNLPDESEQKTAYAEFCRTLIGVLRTSRVLGDREEAALRWSSELGSLMHV